MKIKEQIYDVLATLLGVIVGSGILLTVDYAKLFAGDTAEMQRAGAAVASVVAGWLTNKQKNANKEPKEETKEKN